MSSDPTKTNHRTEQTSASGIRATVGVAVRAFGVVLGPSLVLVLYALLGTGAVLSGSPISRGSLTMRSETLERDRKRCLIGEATLALHRDLFDGPPRRGPGPRPVA